MCIDIVASAPPTDPQVLRKATADVFDLDSENPDTVPEGGMGLATIRMNIDEVE